MLAYTRELLIDKLAELSELQSDFNKTGQIQAIEPWLTELEESIGRLRNPLSSVVANTQSEIRAIWGGFRKDGIDASLPPKKARRIAVSLALVQLSEAITSEVLTIDQKFEMMSDKLAQLLAGASALSPLPAPDNGNIDKWKNDVWKVLGQHEATLGMYTYLSSSLARADREYILGSMLSRLAEDDVTMNFESNQ